MAAAIVIEVGVNDIDSDLIIPETWARAIREILTELTGSSSAPPVLNLVVPRYRNKFVGLEVAEECRTHLNHWLAGIRMRLRRSVVVVPHYDFEYVDALVEPLITDREREKTQSTGRRVHQGSHGPETL